MNENDCSKLIVDSAIEVHRILGPGMLEAVYEEALVCELRLRRLEVKRQLILPICYKGLTLATPLRIDIVVDGCVIVECKATPKYQELFESQLLTYLKMSKLKLGLVINFGERLVKNGIHRVVNGL